MEISKTEFEKWANLAGYDLRRLDGKYITPTTEAAWQGWNAVYESAQAQIKQLLEQLNGELI